MKDPWMLLNLSDKFIVEVNNQNRNAVHSQWASQNLLLAQPWAALIYWESVHSSDFACKSFTYNPELLRPPFRGRNKALLLVLQENKHYQYLPSDCFTWQLFKAMLQRLFIEPNLWASIQSKSTKSNALWAKIAVLVQEHLMHLAQWKYDPWRLWVEDSVSAPPLKRLGLGHFKAENIFSLSEQSN